MGRVLTAHDITATEASVVFFVQSGDEITVIGELRGEAAVHYVHLERVAHELAGVRDACNVQPHGYVDVNYGKLCEALDGLSPQAKDWPSE